MTPSSSTSSSNSTPSATPTASAKPSNWSQEEVQLLVKAVNLFPAGTVRRWETVAGFINTHSTGGGGEGRGGGRKEKDAKMVITKVKALQKLEAEQKESLNKEAFSHFEKQHPPKDKTKAAEQPQAIPSERYGTFVGLYTSPRPSPQRDTVRYGMFVGLYTSPRLSIWYICGPIYPSPQRDTVRLWACTPASGQSSSVEWALYQTIKGMHGGSL